MKRCLQDLGFWVGGEYFGWIPNRHCGGNCVVLYFLVLHS